MRRRALLGLASSVGALSLAGCSGIFGEEDESDTDEITPGPKPTKKAPPKTDPESIRPSARPATDLPEECPVSTIAEYSPPVKPTPSSVESFVRAYEEAYMFQEEFLSPEDVLTQSGVRSTTQMEYGYTVEAQFSGVDLFLQVSIHAEPGQTGPEPADLSALDSQELVDVARRAVDEQQAVVEQLSPPWDETNAQAVARQLRAEIQALPGDDTGGYVAVDGTAVRLQVDVDEIHADYFTYSVLYYVDPHVVRRQSLAGTDAVAQEGELLECRADRT
jgi:hypothetical protein